MSDVWWPLHRRHAPTDPTPVQQAASALTRLARDLQTASDHLLEQHPSRRDSPPPTGAQR